MQAVGVVVLAAGGSKRLGSPKQLVRYRGRTLLRHAAEVALGSGGSPVVVVLGAEVERLRAELDGLDLRVVENAHWAEGLSTSVRAGLEALELADAAGALFTTCDQPLVTSELLQQIIAVHATSHAPIVACEYGDAVGVPALFVRSLWGELRSLPGDSGARRVIERHLTEVVRMPFPEAAVDVDETEDAGRLESQL